MNMKTFFSTLFSATRRDWLLSLLFLAIAGLCYSLGAPAEGLVLAVVNPMRSTDFKAIVEPILNKAFDGVYDLRGDEWKQVFREEDGIPRAYHEEPVLFGFNAAPELPDGMPVTYQQGGILFTKRYVYKVYGLGYALTLVLVEDGDAVRIGAIYAKHLAQSLIETKETKCANEINRGFNALFPGGDGVSLFNAAHPLAGGATASNILAVAAALSQTSLEQMLIQVRSTVDNNGKKIRITPLKLVISPSNVFQAEVLLKSVLRAGTNNNDINPVKSMGLLSADPAVLSRLTSATAWSIQTNAPEGMKILMRRSMKKSMEGDFETDSMRYKATERYETGWTDWRTMFGTPGA
jgi:Mu-like prophage major head subunit gpT